MLRTITPAILLLDAGDALQDADTAYRVEYAPNNYIRRYYVDRAMSLRARAMGMIAKGIRSVTLISQ